MSKRISKGEELWKMGKIMIKKISNIEEAIKCLELVSVTFKKFQMPEYSEDGVRNFYDFINVENFFPQIKNNEISLYGYFNDSQLVGVLGIRKPNHLCLLFVDEKFHKRGIAKQLFNNWLEENRYNLEFVTVNSSLYAVEMYRKLGFSGSSSIKENDGIKYVPLVFTLDKLS